MEQKCIWCNKNKPEVSFKQESHILPKKLGSKQICKDVCDSCNDYFGERVSPVKPSIDIALKEMFILTKYQLVGTHFTYQKLIGEKIDKNILQTLNRNTEFFQILQKDGKHGFKIKNAFKHHLNKPSFLTNQIKRGLFKIAFEVAHQEQLLVNNFESFYHSRFDYIRDYVRRDRGNLKIFYLQKNYGAVLSFIDLESNPTVILNEIENLYLEIEVLNHRFAFSIGKLNLSGHKFLGKYLKKESLFKPIEVKSFLDIDIFNKIFQRK